MIETLAKIAGAGPDEIRILLVVLLQIPLSFLYRSLSCSAVDSNFKRRIFGAAVGLAADFYLFGINGMALIIGNVIVTYFVAFQCKNPKTTIKINFVTFSFLCIINIWRLIVDYEGNTNNICLLAMLTVPKQIYFNWHVHEQLKAEKVNIPSMFDYFCYVFNYIGSIASPVYSYPEYEHFLNQTYKEDKVNSRAVLKKAGSGILALGIIVISAQYFDFDLFISKRFWEINVVYQIILMTIGGVLIRTKYYIIWHFSEIPAIICNVRGSDSGYKSYIKAISSRSVEFSNSPKLRIEKWNMSIAKWLKECFYMPMIENFKVDKNASSMITFILSAFWHGFYPTYYISFFALNILSMTEKLMFQHADLFRYFPSFFFRLQFDICGLLFKRFLFREWILLFKNIWMYFVWIFIVFLATKFIVSKKIKKERKPKTDAN
jgi:lysophospholipid acyltransferase